MGRWLSSVQRRAVIANDAMMSEQWTFEKQMEITESPKAKIINGGSEK